jgi:hypothetical protein
MTDEVGGRSEWSGASPVVLITSHIVWDIQTEILRYTEKEEMDKKFSIPNVNV